MAPRIAFVVTLAATSVACTAPTGPPESTAYILLDQETRRTTRVTAEGWTGSPVLPLGVEASAAITVSGPRGSYTPRLRAGAVAYVHASGASIEWLELGRDVRRDRLLVRGSEEAATDLAARLAAEIAPDGDGTFRLTASDIFDRASFMVPSDAIVEALPDVDATPSEGPSSPALAVAMPTLPPALLPQPHVHDVSLVGVYASKNQLLFLDASGGFTLQDSCDGSMTMEGRYYPAEGKVVLLGEGEPLLLARQGDVLARPDGPPLTWVVPDDEQTGGEP
jgi:hypothetical protein